MAKTTNKSTGKKTKCACPYDIEKETDMYLGVHQNLSGTKASDFLTEKIEITKNGSYNVTRYTDADVNVQGGGGKEYSAGDGIKINNDTISADFDRVQEKLTPGEGVKIEGTTISFDADEAGLQKELIAGEGIVIVTGETRDTISVEEGKYQEKLTAGTGVKIEDNVISVNDEQLQKKLIAGSGVTIEEGVSADTISFDAESAGLQKTLVAGTGIEIATGETEDTIGIVLSAGTGIEVDGNIISVVDNLFQKKLTADDTINLDEQGNIGANLSRLQEKLHGDEYILVDGSAITFNDTTLQKKLSAGTGIEISGNTLSVKLLGVSGITVDGDKIGTAFAFQKKLNTVDNTINLDDEGNISVNTSSLQKKLIAGSGVTIEEGVSGDTISIDTESFQRKLRAKDGIKITPNGEFDDVEVLLDEEENSGLAFNEGKLYAVTADDDDINDILNFYHDVDKADFEADLLIMNVSGSVSTDAYSMTKDNKTVTITINNGEELGSFNVPTGINYTTLKITGAIKPGAKINIVETGKTLYIDNTSFLSGDITFNSKGSIYICGEFDDITTNTNIYGNNNKFANVHGDVEIRDAETPKAIQINANFIGDDNTVTYSGTQNITINAKNENASVNIECPNATVVLGAGEYDKVEANVADNTLKFNTLNIHINKLNLKHGYIFINDGKNVLSDLVDEIVCSASTVPVDYNKATVLPNSPAACEYNLGQDKNGAVTWGTFAAGNTVINLNGHNIHNNGTDGRPTLNVRNKAIVDINGEGEVSNDNEYAVWGNGADTVININGGLYRGTSHAIYSYLGTIYINGGEFELNDEPTPENTDKNGLFKFLINCYDANFTAGKAKIIVKGGKFHNFNPAEAYGEPIQPWNYVAEGYESVKDPDSDVYIVRKITE